MSSLAVSDWASMVAVAISLLALGFTGWSTLQNRARLRLRVTQNYIEVEKPDAKWLHVEIVNFGAHPTSITGLVLVAWPSLLDAVLRRKRGAKDLPLWFLWAKERHEKPVLVEPGRLLTFTFPVRPEMSAILDAKHSALALRHTWGSSWRFLEIGERARD